MLSLFSLAIAASSPLPAKKSCLSSVIALTWEFCKYHHLLPLTFHDSPEGQVLNCPPNWRSGSFGIDKQRTLAWSPHFFLPYLLSWGTPQPLQLTWSLWAKNQCIRIFGTSRADSFTRVLNLPLPWSNLSLSPAVTFLRVALSMSSLADLQRMPSLLLRIDRFPKFERMPSTDSTIYFGRMPYCCILYSSRRQL